MSVRHLYVHLPFCGHRCGYCDFVTVVGREGEHTQYTDALLEELQLEREVLDEPLDTVFVGGGTPTFTGRTALSPLLDALPAADEITVEANPETVTAPLADALRNACVSRISLGAQSFQSPLLGVLERRAGPDDVRRAVHTLRDASFDNISLDLLYGIPGQTSADLDADLAEALALEPEHLSCYELESKPGTRFAHTHGNELSRQAEAMEGYFEQVVETLEAAGYRWYETANFCRQVSASAQREDDPSGRDLRAQHNLGYWRADDYLGLGIGAVSTVAGVRWRNLPRLGGYLRALSEGERPRREVEPLDERTRATERLMLGLRLDEPLTVDAEIEAVLDQGALGRLVDRGLVELGEQGGQATLRLSRRGRFLGGGVTAELLATPEPVIVR